MPRESAMRVVTHIMVACLVLCPARCFVFAMGRVSRDSSTADFDGLFVYKRQFLSSGPACSAHLRRLALKRSLVLAILFLFLVRREIEHGPEGEPIPPEKFSGDSFREEHEPALTH